MGNAAFEIWLIQRVPNGLRYGQHLMNTAPEHVYGYVIDTCGFDPFYAEDKTAPVVQRFIMLAELIWDETDVRQMDLARELVVDEIPF